MFDFTNYTFSGLLSMLSALFGLACPLIIGKVEDIDKRYHSTLLSKRFMHETIFIVTALLLIVNLLVAIIFPFLMDGNIHSRLLVTVQVCIFTLLITAVFFLFYKMLVYVNPSALQDEILADYRKSIGNKKNEELYFKQWIDLTETLLLSSDDKIAQSVYREWYEYVLRVNRRAEEFGVHEDFDDYFLDAISHINETLCKSKKRPISVNNGNSIMKSLLSYYVPMTEKRYTHLWRNLRIQLFYNRDEWIMEYWKEASQIYQMFMRERGEDERWRFLEFHIMLCAMLLQEKKYELVRQMLSYSNTQPESYPLVPSTMADILMCFNKINATANDVHNIVYYEQHYSMPNMYGICDGQIVGAACSYLTLLLYRVYILNHIYGANFAFSVGINANTLAELYQCKNNIQILKYWLPKVKLDKNLLWTINVDDVEKMSFDRTQDGTQVPSPDDIVSTMEEEISTRMEQLRRNQPLDVNKIEKSKQNVVSSIDNFVKPYQILRERRNGYEVSKACRCDSYQLFENRAFLANPDIGYSGIEDVMSSSVLHLFVQSIAFCFYQCPKKKTYTISFDDLVLALNNLELSEEFIIISAGFSLENISSNYPSEIEAKNEFMYKHKSGALIYEFPRTVNEPLNNWLYILRTNDLPYVEFVQPSEQERVENHLEERNPELGIWMSIIKLRDDNNLKERYKGDLGDKVEEYLLYALCWHPKLYTKKHADLVAIRVWRKFWDEGNYDDVNIVTPFEINEK